MVVFNVYGGWRVELQLFDIKAMRKTLAEIFDNHVVALQHEVEWFPRSTDLTPRNLCEVA